MTEGEIFLKNEFCKPGHRSAMSNSAWCDLKKDCIVLKLHDMSHNLKCICQKQINFTPRRFQLEVGSIRSKLRKNSTGTQTAGSKFLKSAVNVAAPFIGMSVIAKTTNPKVGQATTSISKSISCGKTLSLTDMHSNGLRLNVM